MIAVAVEASIASVVEQAVVVNSIVTAKASPVKIFVIRII
jgi:hypothetical protein